MIKWFMDLEVFWRVLIFTFFYVWGIIGLLYFANLEHFGIFVGTLVTIIIGGLGGLKSIGVQM